ncbi:cytochrome c [Marinobacteraceae bacterium S3BR75-40.1]
MKWKTSGCLALLLSLSWAFTVQADDVAPAELRNLVRQDCGSCHGMTLKGGLGPSLRPERMQRYTVAAIGAIIRQGVPDTAMPPWGPLLNDDEIRWISEQLHSGAILEPAAAAE